MFKTGRLLQPRPVCAELLDVCVQARGDGAHLVLREPGDAHLLGRPLHLAGAGTRGVHLGHGGHEGAVDAPVAPKYALREEAAGAQLGDARRQRADAGGETALPVAVRPFAPPPHSWSASASITAFATRLASLRSSSCMSMPPSSKRGMASMSGDGPDKISAAVFVLSQNLLLW